MCIEESLVRWIVFCNLVSNSAYSVVAPFLPIEFERKEIVGTAVGMIFALYSVGVIVMAPIIGKNVDRVGAKNTISLGLGCMGTTFICFGFIEVM